MQWHDFVFLFSATHFCWRITNDERHFFYFISSIRYTWGFISIFLFNYFVSCNDNNRVDGMDIRYFFTVVSLPNKTLHDINWFNINKRIRLHRLIHKTKILKKTLSQVKLTLDLIIRTICPWTVGLSINYFLKRFYVHISIWNMWCGSYLRVWNICLYIEF